MTTEATPWARIVGLPGGPVLALVMLTSPPPGGMEAAAWQVAAVGVWMAVWWMTEAIPIAMTALMPLVLFPALGVLAIGPSAAPYANPVIFLFLGGFILARALAACGLHRRLALHIILAVGTRPVRLVGGLMLATAVISMWVSNTATVVMMYPIALSVIELVERDDPGSTQRFALAALLGIACAANIGGLGTLIGTPPNALLAGFMQETYGRGIGFAEWMLVGVPLVAVALPLAWSFLVHRAYPLGDVELRCGREAIASELRALGPLSHAERVVGSIAVLTAVAWITRPLLESLVPGLSDAGIAVIAALLVFAVPVERDGLRPVLTWAEAERLPWGVLILFGGGLSLAHAIDGSGLSVWLGQALAGLGTWHWLVVAVALTGVVLLLTEITSNTATAAVFLPIVAAIAIATDIDPMLFAAPVALAASCAFMMPVATPPNAIVYGSGRVPIGEMLRTGVWFNAGMLVLINSLGLALIGWVLAPS